MYMLTGTYLQVTRASLVCMSQPQCVPAHDQTHGMMKTQRRWCCWDRSMWLRRICWRCDPPCKECLLPSSACTIADMALRSASSSRPPSSLSECNRKLTIRRTRHAVVRVTLKSMSTITLMLRQTLLTLLVTRGQQGELVLKDANKSN